MISDVEIAPPTHTCTHAHTRTHKSTLGNKSEVREISAQWRGESVHCPELVLLFVCTSYFLPGLQTLCRCKLKQLQCDILQIDRCANLRKSGLKFVYPASFVYPSVHQIEPNSARGFALEITTEDDDALRLTNGYVDAGEVFFTDGAVSLTAGKARMYDGSEQNSVFVNGGVCYDVTEARCTCLCSL